MDDLKSPWSNSTSTVMINFATEEAEKVSAGGPPPFLCLQTWHAQRWMCVYYNNVLSMTIILICDIIH